MADPRTLMSSEHAFDAGLMGFDGPTQDNHTSLEVEELKHGLYFTICSEGCEVTLFEHEAEHFAKDILKAVEVRRAAASKGRAA